MGIGFYHRAPEKFRYRTVTRVRKPFCMVPVEQVRMTQNIPLDDRNSRRRLPIVVIEDTDDDQRLFVLDGNHRFATWRDVPGCEAVPAWVLEDGDQEMVYGKMTSTVRAWKDGTRTWLELLESAIERYCITVDDEQWGLKWTP